MKPNKSASDKTKPRKSQLNQLESPSVWRRLSIDAKAAWQDVLVEPLAALSAILIIAVTLLLPLVLLTAEVQLSASLNQYASNPQLVAYLEDSATQDNISEVSERLLSRGDISLIEVVSKDIGLDQLSQQDGFAELLAELNVNPLPDVLLITPLSNDVAALESMADELMQDPNIDSIGFDSAWLLRLQAVIDIISQVSGFITALCAAAFILVVGNTVASLIQSKQQEIRIQKLIGANDLFIVKPLIFRSLYYGLGGASCAILLQVLVLLMLTASLTDFFELYNSSGSPTDLHLSASPLVALATIGVSGVLAACAALVFALKQIRRIED